MKNYWFPFLQGDYVDAEAVVTCVNFKYKYLMYLFTNIYLLNYKIYIT